MNLRPEVQAFAEMMEARLRVNDHKGGWNKDSQAVLLARLYANLPELPSLEACVDVANYALMLAVPCGVPEPLIGASEPPGSVQCGVCKAITAPGNGCSAEDCPVGVAAVEAPSRREQVLQILHCADAYGDARIMASKGRVDRSEVNEAREELRELVERTLGVDSVDGGQQ